MNNRLLLEAILDNFLEANPKFVTKLGSKAVRNRMPSYMQNLRKGLKSGKIRVKRSSRGQFAGSYGRGGGKVTRNPSRRLMGRARELERGRITREKYPTQHAVDKPRKVETTHLRRAKPRALKSGEIADIKKFVNDYYPLKADSNIRSVMAQRKKATKEITQSMTAPHPKVALDFDGSTFDDNRAVLEYVNRMRPAGKKVTMGDLQTYDPWRKRSPVMEKLGIQPWKMGRYPTIAKEGPNKGKVSSMTRPGRHIPTRREWLGSGLEKHEGKISQKSLKRITKQAEKKFPITSGMSERQIADVLGKRQKMIGGSSFMKGMKQGGYPKLKVSSGSKHKPTIGERIGGGGGVWHSMERTDVPEMMFAVEGLEKMHRATGQPVRIVTARIPGASIKDAAKSMRTAGLNKKVPINATSTRSKLDYIVANGITDYLEDKPDELFNLVVNGPPHLRVHTIDQPWTGNASRELNKWLAANKHDKKIIIHPSWRHFTRDILERG
jgi:hypothetical protein